MPPEETDPNAPVKLEAPKPDEQPVHPLDQIFKDEGGDQLHLEHPTLDAGIETPAETAQPAPAEAAPAETSKEEPPKEQPPKEEPPKEQPPVEAKPHPKGPSWKQMKELQKQLKEANQAKEAAEQKLSQRPPAETLLDEELPIEDPLTKVTRDVGDVKATVAQTAEELKRLRANQEQQAVTEQIKVEESTFSRDHADYPKAVQFLVEKRLSHYEKSGRVERAATFVAESMTEFSVYPTALSAFPRINRPSVIWIGLGGESEKLNLLTKKLIDTLMRFGVKIITSGDIYSPHITLARIKTQGKHRQFSQLRDLIENTKINLKSFQIPIRQIMAYKSDLRHLGPKHIPLFSAPLKPKITKSISSTAGQPGN